MTALLHSRIYSETVVNFFNFFFNIRMYQCKERKKEGKKKEEKKKKVKKEEKKKMNIVVVNRNSEEHTEAEKAYETASTAH